MCLQSIAPFIYHTIRNTKIPKHSFFFKRIIERSQLKLNSRRPPSKLIVCLFQRFISIDSVRVYIYRVAQILVICSAVDTVRLAAVIALQIEVLTDRQPMNQRTYTCVPEQPHLIIEFSPLFNCKSRFSNQRQRNFLKYVFQLMCALDIVLLFDCKYYKTMNILTLIDIDLYYYIWSLCFFFNC